MKTLALAAISLALAHTAEARDSEIYRGEPFAEALHDIVLSGAIAISHPSARASSTERTDVFQLRDSRFLAILSASEKLGQPYTIQKITIATSAHPQEFKPVNELKLSSPSSR